MNYENHFAERLQRKKNEFTKKQLMLADYVLKNMKSVVFMTSSLLGEKNGVSDATVIRFAQMLGYQGFSDMIRDIQDYVKSDLTTIDKFESFENLYKDKSITDEIINSNQLVIRFLKKNIEREQIIQVAEMMMKSKKIIVAGFEGSSGIAEYFGYNLVRIFNDVEVISHDRSSLFNTLKNANSDWMVFILAFPRYTKAIVNMCKFLKDRNVSVVSFTDSILSPVKELSDISFIIPMHENYSASYDVMVGVITVMQAVILEYSSKNIKVVEENLKKLEKYNKNFDLFL